MTVNGYTLIRIINFLHFIFNFFEGNSLPNAKEN